MPRTCAPQSRAAAYRPLTPVKAVAKRCTAASSAATGAPPLRPVRRVVTAVCSWRSASSAGELALVSSASSNSGSCDNGDSVTNSMWLIRLYLVSDRGVQLQVGELRWRVGAGPAARRATPGPAMAGNKIGSARHQAYCYLCSSRRGGGFFFHCTLKGTVAQRR